MNAPLPQHSFRRKLLVHVGLSVGGVFVLTFLLLWMGSTLWFRVDAERFLRNEAESIAGVIVRAGGEIHVENYTWNEPHHLFAEPRIDPVFVQVFDKGRRELFSTQNIASFTPGAWPGYLIDDPDEPFTPSEELDIRFIGQARLYFLTQPLVTADESVIGYVQAARYVPDIEGRMLRILLTSGIVLMVLLVGLLLSIHARAGKLLRPLQAIAETADRISARKLDVRLEMGPDMDAETLALSQSFNRLLDRLDASFSDMRRFTSNAAHQLQTPLTVLKGHVDVALRKDRDEDSYRQTLSVVRGEIRDMTVMVRSLLMLARSETPMDMPPFQPVSVEGLVTRIQMLYQEAADRLVYQLEPGLCVRGHQEWLQMALENLVDNALKYAPEGPVRIESAAQENQIRILVQDAGPGIAEEDLAHLTERFFRGSNAREAGVRGDGLGLAIVERLVTLQSGTVRLASDAEGTRITILLPAC